MLFHIINKKKSLKKNNNLTLDPGQFFFGYQLREQSNHNDIFTHQL